MGVEPKTEVHGEDLVMLIGAKEVELVLLRRKVAALEQQIALLLTPKPEGAPNG